LIREGGGRKTALALECGGISGKRRGGGAKRSVGLLHVVLVKDDVISPSRKKEGEEEGGRGERQEEGSFQKETRGLFSH